MLEGQGILPTLDGPVLVAGPVFICFEITGKPAHKARHRSRVVIPRGVWTPASVSGRTEMVITRNAVKSIFIQNYPDPNTEANEQTIAWAGRRFMASRAPTEQPLSLLVHVFREVPQSWSQRDRRLALMGGILPTGRPDWDNHGKITDALNGIVWKDDSQVVDGRVIKRYSDRPGLRVEVREFVSALAVASPPAAE